VTPHELHFLKRADKTELKCQKGTLRRAISGKQKRPEILKDATKLSSSRNT
jgi:hypothetical protein